MSSQEFNFLDDFEIGTETLEGTTEPAEDETSTLEPPSAFTKISRNLPESSSPGKLKTIKIENLDGISAEQKNRRHCPRMILGKIARRRVGSSPQRP